MFRLSFFFFFFLFLCVVLFLVGNIVVYYYYYYYYFLHIQLSCTIKTIIQHLTMGVFFMCTKFPSLLVNHPLNLCKFFSLFSFLFVNLCKLRLMSQSSFQNFSPPNGLLKKKKLTFLLKKIPLNPRKTSNCLWLVCWNYNPFCNSRWILS